MTEANSIKSSEIGTLPSSWNIVSVDDIKDIGKSVISGPFGSNISSKFFVKSGVPVIRGNNLSLAIGTRFIDKEFVFITEEKAKELGTWASEDDLIFTAVGTIGQVGLLSNKSKYNKYIISNKQLRLTVDKNKIEPLFAYYWFSTPYMREHIISNNTGSSVPLINLGILKSLLIPLPPLNEQRAIAGVLSKLDDKIDLLTRQNATLEAMAEALFRQWFVVKAKEEWEEKSLQEEFNIFIGRTPPRKEQNCFSFENGEKWISIKDMGAPGIFISDSSEYLTQQAINTYRIPLIPKNTVVLSFKMTVGRVKITTAPMYSNEAIACFVPNSTTYLPKEFLYLFLKQYKFDELGTTSSIVTAINSNMIKNIIFKLPPESLLEMFTHQSEKLFAKIRSNQTQIRILEKLRNSLLPKLMSGEVRVALD